MATSIAADNLTYRSADGKQESGHADEDSRSVVARIFTVLGAFESDEMSMSLSELSERTGLPKGTLHRICQQLAGQGAIERTKYGYRLGFRLVELGARVVTTSRLRALAMPYLQELNNTTGCAAHLGIPLGDEVYYLESVCNHLSTSVSARPGVRVLAHTTALGMALLAARPEQGRLAYSRLHGVSQRWLEVEVAQTHVRGIARCCRGGYLIALGGAILARSGEPICGLSVVVPPGGVFRMETGAALDQALRALSNRLLAFGVLGYPHERTVGGK